MVNLTKMFDFTKSLINQVMPKILLSIKEKGMPILSRIFTRTTKKEVEIEVVGVIYEVAKETLGRVKTVAYGLNAAAVGPFSMPLNKATDWLIDMADQKTTLIYNNYNNTQEWRALVSNEQVTKKQEALEDVAIEDGFIDVRRLAAAAA